MTKIEFERLAIRNNEPISYYLYDAIERFYMSDNEYHRAHGGVDESKHLFVKRVFGGKVNTPKTIMEKITEESIRENRYLLQGNPSATEGHLVAMDHLIREHYKTLATMNI